MAASNEKFEIVFSFDTTGSMYGYLAEVRRQLKSMLKDLKNNIPRIKLAIFAHGDYDTYDTYVTTHKDFTSDVGELCTFVDSVGMTGGHGPPECYERVLYEVKSLSWSRDSQKSLVVIGDARPHEPFDGEEKKGINWREETKKLRDLGVKIYAVQCGDISKSRLFYNTIASQTFGSHFSLSKIEEVTGLLKTICYREAGLKHLYSGVAPDVSPVPENITVSSSVHSTHMSSKNAAPIDDDVSFDEEQTGLICEVCKIGKLSNEFPPTTLTEDCEHAPGICLRCTVKHVEEKKTCPTGGCGKAVDPDCNEMNWFRAILDEMFLDYSKVIAANRRQGGDGDGEYISVATLNGDTAWIEFDASMTIESLKTKIKKEFKIEPKQQKLLYQEQGMKTKKGPGGLAQLSDYGVKANDTIYLLVPLYCVPEDLNHVVFDLSWEFPKTNPDFLDASCFAFENENFVQVIDWNHPTNEFYLKGSIKHSEKNKTLGRTGHQSINVHLRTVPTNITHLYFTLSSWRSPNLSGFANPSLQFYDAADPSIDLCETTFGHALNSQAVIMCSVVRSGRMWNIFDNLPDALVNGNSKKYNPIRQRISEMVKEDTD